MALSVCGEANGERERRLVAVFIPKRRLIFITPGSRSSRHFFTAMKKALPQDSTDRRPPGAQTKTSRAKGTCRQKVAGPKRPAKRRTMAHPDAAGIDIGSKEHSVAVPPGRAAPNGRHFSAYTEGLLEMAQWLHQCGVTTVAMESTGVYWLPVDRATRAGGLRGVAGRCPRGPIRPRA
jgi:hypothetical protein